MKKVLGITLILILVLTGCKSVTVITPPNVDTTPQQNPPQQTSLGIPLDAPDTTWVAPGKVNISNMYPGARAEFAIQIHNGEKDAVTFTVEYSAAHKTLEGYTNAPHNTFQWVTIAEPLPVLQPDEVKDVLVILDIPKDVNISSDKWEFWIIVRANQTGTMQTQSAIRWLVDMKD